MIPIPLSSEAAKVFDAWAAVLIDFRKQQIADEKKTHQRGTSTTKPNPKESKT